MDVVDRFAALAEDYERWARDGKDGGAGAAREALTRIAALYQAALELPASSPDTDEPESDGVDDAEWRAVFDAASRRLPFAFYGAVLEPFAEPRERGVEHGIADDVADVYRDVVGGLRAYRAGRRADAVWGWGFGFETHWGEHATN